MSWEEEVLTASPSDLVARNGADLLAVLLQQEVKRHRASRRQSREERAATRASLTRAEKIGRAVMVAERTGRKTIRVADLLATE